MRARLTLAALALVLVGCPPPASQPQGSLPLPATRSEPTPSLPEPARRQRVALFVPHKDPFWREFRRFMRAACEQLDLGYEVHLAHNNREEMKAQLRAAVAGPDPARLHVNRLFQMRCVTRYVKVPG